DMSAESPKRHTLDGQVVCLGRATQKHDAIGTAADHSAHLRARRAKGLAGLLPKTVASCRIAHPPFEERAHDCQNPVAPRGEARIVKIGGTGGAYAAREPVGSS